MKPFNYIGIKRVMTREAISIVLLCFLSGSLHAQVLVSNEYERGYAKDGKKYQVWYYYNDKKEVELSLNHTTGKVYFLKEDTTAFVIIENGEWVNRKIRVYAIPIGGYSLFYQTLRRTLRYPEAARS
jgi:hypothetical protein